MPRRELIEVAPLENQEATEIDGEDAIFVMENS